MRGLADERRPDGAGVFLSGLKGIWTITMSYFHYMIIVD